MSGYVCMMEYIDCTEVAFHPRKIRGSRAIDKNSYSARVGPYGKASVT